MSNQEYGLNISEEHLTLAKSYPIIASRIQGIMKNPHCGQNTELGSLLPSYFINAKNDSILYNIQEIPIKQVLIVAIISKYKLKRMQIKAIQVKKK